LIGSSGGENAYDIGRELGEEMTAASTVVKNGERLEKAIGRLGDLGERYGRLTLSDTGMWTNQNLSYSRSVGDMLLIGDAILRAGLNRKESRGAHFREDFPKRDDANYLKTTVATYNASSGHADISLEDVEIGLVEPRQRTYGAVPSDDKNKEKTPAGAGSA
jgi:succinate dehydrogenase / fumarate reductase flavoprotein subunit